MERRNVVPAALPDDQADATLLTGSRADTLAEAYLREYDVLWGELLGRWETQRHAFNFVVGVVSATIAGAYSSEIALPSEFAFVVPWLVAPFAFMFFDNEIMIWSIVRYTRHDLRPRLQTMLQDDRLMMHELSRFKHVHPRVKVTHLTLSVGRWLVFVLPMLAAPIYGMHESSRPFTPITLAITAADFGLLCYFGWVMFIAVAERLRAWDATGEAPRPLVSLRA